MAVAGVKPGEVAVIVELRGPSTTPSSITVTLNSPLVCPATTVTEGGTTISFVSEDCSPKITSFVSGAPSVTRPWLVSTPLPSATGVGTVSVNGGKQIG